MTTRECYEIMDADYEDVLRRLTSERLVQKFNLKFQNATDYRQLLEALNSKDYTEAFRMAHNLKGMSLNLGYTGLYGVSNELCEALRGGEPKAEIGGVLAELKAKYEQVLAGIAMMETPI